MAQSTIEAHLQTLHNLFPNIDPDFLKSIAIKCEHNEAELQKQIENLLNNNSSHPTREQWINRRQNQQLISCYTDFFNVEDFLNEFPDRDPVNYFTKVKAGKAHAHLSCQYLRDRYPTLTRTTVRTHLEKKRYSLTKTVSHLDKSTGGECQHRNANLVCKTIERMTSGGEINRAFLQEVVYIEHKEEIKVYLKEMADRRIQKFEQAKEAGMLSQCGCCFDTEILTDETLACSGGHLFCEPCVHKYVKIRLGAAETSFPCMSAACGSGEFKLDTLQLVMEPREFSAFLRRQQLEEIQSAGINDLEICPLCGFANIVAEDSKVFLCLNEDCRKESCRKCKKESHLPFKCKEKETADDRARKFVEDKLSAALIRECYRCHRKYVKDNTGCNHIECPGCHAHMCYVCRQPLDSTAIYTHFVAQGGPTNSKKCPLFSDAHLLHVEAIQNVAKAVNRSVRRISPYTRVDASTYVPNRIRGPNQRPRGAPEQRNAVMRHTLRTANLK